MIEYEVNIPNLYVKTLGYDGIQNFGVKSFGYYGIYIAFMTILLNGLNKFQNQLF